MVRRGPFACALASPLILLIALSITLSACGGDVERRDSGDDAGGSAARSAVDSETTLDGSASRPAGADGSNGAATRGDDAGGTALSGVATDEGGLRLVVYRAPTMGTVGSITLAVPDSVHGFPTAVAAKSAWDRVDSLMSNWTETSEVARINREAGVHPVVVNPEVATVLARALKVGAESGGAYDITVEPLVRLWGFLGGRPAVPAPSAIEDMLPRVGLQGVDFTRESRTLRFAHPEARIDLGGIAKGCGVDAAIDTLRALGVAVAMVDLSGNLRTIGLPPGRDHWTIGIRDPRDRVPYFARLSIRVMSMATAGNYQQFVSEDGKQYGHILDPRTGWPVEGLLSVTVVTPRALDADAWDTALYVMGSERARSFLAAREDLDGILVEPGASAAASARSPGALDGEGHTDGAGSTGSGGTVPGTRDIVWVERALLPSFAFEPGAEAWFELRAF